MGFVRSALVQSGLLLVLQQASATWWCHNTNTLPSATGTCPTQCANDHQIEVDYFTPSETIGTCDGNTPSITVTGRLKYRHSGGPSPLYDLGMWVGSEGGSCNVYSFQCLDSSVHSAINYDDDSCADITIFQGSTHYTVFEHATLEVPCIGDGSGDGYGLKMDYCVSWSDPASQSVCGGANHIIAGSGDTSNCGCGTYVIPGIPVTPYVRTCPVASDFSLGAIVPLGVCSGGGTKFIIPIVGLSLDLVNVAFSIIDVATGGQLVASSTLTGGIIVATLPPNAHYELTLVLTFVGVTCETIVLPFTATCDCKDADGNADNTKCDNGQLCCPDEYVCEDPDPDTGACGDPHMTGFLGQKFDFTGEDGGWYSLIADGSMNVNMRVTSPVADLPEVTYITGLSVLTTDADGFGHSIVIEVKDPHNLDSSCPAGVSPCLADGSVSVVLDGEETLLAPGTVSLGQDVEISAVNLPGACRSFGFEKYWERKQLENARHGRRLGEQMSMSEWILADPTATNMEECTEYVARAEVEEGGLFAHQSEHASFQIVTPKATIRLSHGRLHQIATRDPTDQFDLPDHLTWQMNMAVDHNEVSRDAKGVLGETFVPTRDASGEPIMTGMEAIRGTQEDYRVEGALMMDFVQDAHTF